MRGKVFPRTEFRALLERYMEDNDLSMRELSLKLGQNETWVSQQLTRPYAKRGLSSKVLNDLSDLLNISRDKIDQLVERHVQTLMEFVSSSGGRLKSGEFTRDSAPTSDNTISFWRTSPGDGDEDFILLTENPCQRLLPVGLILPPALRALRVIGTAMCPRYLDGSVILVDSDRDTTVGDDVVVGLPTESAGRYRAYVRTLTDRNRGTITLQGLNPPEKTTLTRADVGVIVPVVPWVAVLGIA